MRPFGKRSATLRGFAALVSLALTGAIFMLLRATPGPHAPKRGEPPVAVALVPSLPARPRPAPPAVEAAAATRDPRRAAAAPRATPPRAKTGPATEAATAPATTIAPAMLPADVAAVPGAATEPASAPLRLDARTIGRAIARSEGDIRRMARTSGVDLDSPRQSRADALAATVAGNGVPDCLAPNAGGSLLSVPILLVRAVQGRCK